MNALGFVAVSMIGVMVGGVLAALGPIEPGAVDTALDDQITDEKAKEASKKGYDSMRTLHAEDLANAIVYTVTQPNYVSVNEVLIRPMDHPTP